MAVFNRTKTQQYPTIPDFLLEDICNAAAKWIGCDNEKVHVKIKWSKNNFGGFAQFISKGTDGEVQESKLTGRKADRENYLYCAGGFIKLIIPWDTNRYRHVSSFFEVALGIFQILVHEYAHIIDFQNYGYTSDKLSRIGRRPKHALRKAEQMVYARIKKIAREKHNCYLYGKQDNWWVPYIPYSEYPTEVKEAIELFEYWLEEHKK